MESIKISNFKLISIVLFLFFIITSFQQNKAYSEILHQKTYLFRPDHNQNLKIEGNGYEIQFSVMNAGFMEDNNWVWVIWYIDIYIDSQNAGWFKPSVHFKEKDILNYKEEIRYIDKDNLKFKFKVVDYTKVYNNNQYYFRDVSIKVTVERFE